MEKAAGRSSVGVSLVRYRAKFVSRVFFPVVVVAILMAVLAASCVPPAAAPGSATALPVAQVPAAQAPVAQAPTSAAAAGTTRIYAPGTPASVPVIMAAKQMPDAQVTIFNNHSQAATLFLRGDSDILVTGLSVGVEFFKNGAPVQTIDCNVSGLTYLITYNRKVSSFEELKGQELYIPFEGSPIEETSQFFAEKAGLAWKTDIKPVYSPFDSSVALLKQGKVAAVALPEPYVTLVEGQPNVYISLSYRQQWDALTGTKAGYPQVCAFVRKPWADEHRAEIARFNQGMQDALASLARDPDAAVAATQASLGQPAAVLSKSLARTDFALYRGQEMAEQIRGYYQTIGKPLNDAFEPFFYRDSE